MDVKTLLNTLTPEEMATIILREQEEKAELQKRTAKQDDAIASLQRHVNWLTNVLWGARSERRVLDHLEPQEQLLLDGTMLNLPKEPPPDSETVENLSNGRKNNTKVTDKSTGGARFDENVPTIEVPVEDLNIIGVSLRTSLCSKRDTATELWLSRRRQTEDGHPDDQERTHRRS